MNKKDTIKKLALKINRLAKSRANELDDNSVDNVVYSEIAFAAAHIFTECDIEYKLPEEQEKESDNKKPNNTTLSYDATHEIKDYPPYLDRPKK